MDLCRTKNIISKCLWIVYFIGFISFGSNAQPYTCADASFGSGNGQQIQVAGAVGLGTFCAPVTVNWFVSFSAVIPAGAVVEVIVDWGDGTDDTFLASESGNIWSISNGNGDNFTSGPQSYFGVNVAKHVYPIDLAIALNRDICFFDIDAQLVIDGNPCSASTLINIVNYWDTDEDDPGNVIIEPILFQVCEGDQVTLSFQDNTIFNCVNAADTDNPNEDLRNVRWTYNTTDGLSPVGRIDGITLSNGQVLDGNNAADHDYVPPTGDVPGSDANTVETYPALVGPGDANSTTLDLTVPNTATEGEVFEIRLENWGPCNPLGGPIDPIIRYAVIEIVAPPRGLDFGISSDLVGAFPKTTFCPGEDIRFRGSTTNETPDFEYDWIIYDGPNDTDPVAFTRNNDKNTWLSDEVADLNTAFSTSGTKLVRMFVKNSDTNLSGNCEVFIDKTIDIISTPQAVIGFNDGSFGLPNTIATTYEICAKNLPLAIELTDESSGKTANLTTRWKIEKMVPTNFLVDNVDDLGGGAAPFDYPSNSLNLLDTGHYQITLYIDDASTNCSTQDQLDIYIYDAPEASFTATGVCEGEDTDFDPSGSNIPTVINGDVIDTYLWDFSFDGVNFNTDLTRNDNAILTQNLGGAGTYSVGLIVQSAKSCVSDTFLLDVEVYPNPNASLTAFYGSEFDGNLVDDAYVGDPICPGTLIKFVNNSDEFSNDPSIIDIGYALEIDSVGTIITRSIGGEGTFTLPDIFYNTTGSNVDYHVKLIAIANPLDGNTDNNCRVESNIITVDVLPGSPSGFNIYEDATESSVYDAANSYCSPHEFFFKIDNLTNNLLNPNDSLIWEVFDGATQLGGDTVMFGDPDYRNFSFEFNNDYPSIAPINYTVNLRPFVAGVCVNPAQNTVRVLPKPDSTFVPTDTVYTCDFVTYSFEATQPGLLAYNWEPQPIAEVSSSTVTDDKYEVSYNRPGIADPALNVSVTLQTVNPFGCISGISDPFEDTIQPKDDFTINLVATGTETCVPSVYNFDNQTIAGDIPANTAWELRITHVGLGTTTVIPGSDLAVTDFSAGFDYEFTQAGDYEIRLRALLESNCDLVSDPPIFLSLNESPTMRFRTVETEGCSPLSVDIIDNSTNPGGTDLADITMSVQNLTTGAPGQVVSINNQAADFFNGLPLNDLVYDDATNAGFNDFAITLTGTNAFGCSDDTTYIVKVYEKPFIDFNIVSPNPACEKDYAFEFDVTTYSVPAGTTLTWNWNDGRDTTVSSPNNVKHTFANRASFYGSDVYNVTLSAQTTNGCVTSVSHPVELNPRIQANFFGDKNIGCSPLNVNYTSLSLGTGILNNHVYKKRVKGTSAWIDFTSSPNNIGSVTETFTNSTSANIIYEVLYLVSSDVGGCLDTADIKEITIYPEFDSPPITGSNKACAFEQDVEYTVPLSTGSNYIWSLPLGAFISDQNIEGNEISVNFSNFSGDISVTEINANGCFGNPSTLAVEVLTGPTASLELAGPNVICPGDSTSLKFNLTGPGTQAFDVVYNNGATNDTLQNIQNGHTIKVGPTNSTNYFLLDVTDREYPACFPSSITGSVFISVNIPPSVTLTGNATVCEGTPTNLFFNLTGIGPWKVKYTDGTNEFNFETSSPVHLESVTPTSSVSYMPIEVTDGNTPICSGNVNGTADIVVNQKSTAEIFGDQNEICANAPTAIKLNLTGVAPWIVRYTDGTNIFTLNNISPPSGYDPATDVYTYSFDVSPPSGTTSYQLVDIRDANIPSCLGDITGSAVIEAYDRPVASLAGNASICRGQSTPLQFNITGDGPFTVRYTANNDTLQANNLNNGETRSVSPETSTIYRIVDVVDVRGCLSNLPSGPVSVNVSQPPTTVLSGADTICFGNQVNLIFDLTGVGPWQINYTDGVQNYNFITTFNRHFEPITPTATRTYKILSITDSNSPNCSNIGTGSPQIVVYPRLDASFTATPEQMVLPKSDVAIVNTTTNINSWQYSWDFGDGTTSTAAEPGTHVYETYGQYIIKLTATNGLCTDTFEQLVTIGAIPPIVDFIATPLEGCIPLVVEFENLTKFADPSTYQWEFGDNQRIRAVENPSHVYTSPGIYTVRLVANNITGQEREVIKEEYITVYETPQASFTIPDQFRQVFSGEEVQFVNTSLRADQFIWKFGDGNESFDENPVHVYPDSGIYDITIIAINSTTGCEDSFKLDAQVKVVFGGESKIANAFTPSRSGPGSASGNVQSNDVFLPQLKGVSTFEMKVYNRWGELLFETKDKNIGWDGYYKGQLMPQGVYVYRLELVYDNGRRETKVGDITLIR